MDLAKKEQLVVFLVYGATGGAKDKAAAALTEAAIQACRAEAKYKYPRMPILIAGDFNLNPGDALTLNRLTQREGWIDVGAHGAWYGADRDAEGTCLAP